MFFVFLYQVRDWKVWKQKQDVYEMKTKQDTLQK